MVKLYLHIGLSKTGTTTVQKFLWEFRKTLFRKYKVLYPETGVFNKEFPAHYMLAFSIYTPDEAKGKIEIPELREIGKKVLEEISISGDLEKSYTIIISCESFMHFRENQVYAKLKNFLKKISEEIKIIIYLRRQDIWHESSYSQVVKDFSTRTSVDFKSSVEYSKSLTWLLFFDNLLSRWQEAFPEAQIIPRIYDRTLFPEGNVILDFLSILGIDMPEAREYKIEANPSLSHLSTLVMRKINEKFDLTPEEHGKVIRYLFKLDREEGSPIKSFFTLPERIEFLEHFRESNERLFREWFGTENKFVLSEEEIKFYEEQDKIPREEIEKMVEDRYRKVLAYMMLHDGRKGLPPKEELFRNLK